MSGFDYIADDIKKGNLDYGFQVDTSCPGTLSISATNRLLPYPVGMLWFRWRGGYAVDIMNIYVVDDLRRLGIATFMFRKMVALYNQVDEVYTQQGSTLGTQWLKSAGFKKRKKGWYFTPAKARKK